MSQFTHDITIIEQNYKQAQDIKANIDVLIAKLSDMNNKYVSMLEAQQLLTTVSDANTTAVLDYITGVINKTLGELPTR